MAKGERKRSKGRERKVIARADRLLEYLVSYTAPPAVQSLNDSSTDNQLKSILTAIASTISMTDAGTVVDVGAGDGILLSRLVDLDVFREKPAWTYVAIDIAERVEKTLMLAVQHRVHRRVDGVSLGEFRERRLEAGQWPHPIIVVCRNVLHELDINDTATLLHKLSTELTGSDSVFIQDLQVFPQAEKGNACWIPSGLVELLRQLGFSCSSIEEPSKTGNRWFNIVARRERPYTSNSTTTATLVRGARERQWQSWSALGALHPDDVKFRDVELAKLDFDLQFAALTAQLNRFAPGDSHILTPDQQAVLIHDSFRRAVMDFTLPSRRDDVLASAFRHFKDRANSQDALKAFMESPRPFTVISGPALMGKNRASTIRAIDIPTRSNSRSTRRSGH